MKLTKLLIYPFILIASLSALAAPEVFVDEENEALVSTGEEATTNSDPANPYPLSALPSLKAWNARDPKIGFLEEDETGAFYYEESDGDGSKEYDTALNWTPKEENYKKGLLEVSSDGAYIFQSNETEQTGAFSIRMGSLTPPKIENETGFTFEDFYGDKAIPVLLYDYEWQNLFGVQYLAFGLGTGISSATGPGRFKSDPSIEAKEKYSFYIIPNHISFSYRFQYWKRQWVAPYVSAGFMPVGIVEFRDDNESTTITSTMASHTSGGLKFNLYALDSHSAFIMDSEYGINNFWLDVEYKLILGLDKKIDVTSQVLNAGLGFDF